MNALIDPRLIAKLLTPCLVLGCVGCAAPSSRGGSRAVALPDVSAAEQHSAADSALAAERRAEMQFQLAEARWRRNEVAACQALLEEVVQRDPYHRGANLRLAEVYLLRKQPFQALSLMQKFCRAQRQDGPAHHLLGLAYEACGQYDRALAAYEMATELDPEDSIIHTSLERALAWNEPSEEIQNDAPPPETVSVLTASTLSAAVNEPNATAEFSPVRPPNVQGPVGPVLLAESQPGAAAVDSVEPTLEMTPGRASSGDNGGLWNKPGGSTLAIRPAGEHGGSEGVRWAYELESAADGSADGASDSGQDASEAADGQLPDSEAATADSASTEGDVTDRAFPVPSHSPPPVKPAGEADRSETSVLRPGNEGGMLPLPSIEPTPY